jgi:predicted alpha/beta-hydrolase family hydrolase
MIEWFEGTTQPAIAQFIFAHGAGAGSDSDFMQYMAKTISEQGVDVGLFDFEYMQIAKQTNKRRPPERAPKLLSYYEQTLTQTQPNLPLFIGGKSMGGRMASMLACTTKQPVKGVIAFGYPFHPPGHAPKSTPRIPAATRVSRCCSGINTLKASSSLSVERLGPSLGIRRRNMPIK